MDRRLLGEVMVGLLVLSRVAGILLAAIAVQMIADSAVAFARQV